MALVPRTSCLMAGRGGEAKNRGRLPPAPGQPLAGSISLSHKEKPPAEAGVRDQARVWRRRRGLEADLRLEDHLAVTLAENAVDLAPLLIDVGVVERELDGVALDQVGEAPGPGL